MRAIVGRLSDLGLGELFRLLETVSATGRLEVESAGEKATLAFSQGRAAGAPSPALVQALTSRSGTFCFRPGETDESDEWLSAEEFIVRVEEATAREPADMLADEADLAGSGSGDPLDELRSSLAEVTLPGVVTRILVFASDPRPYRAMESSWRDKGWEAMVLSEPSWPEGLAASLAILHLPSSSTLAGQGELWLSLIQRATVEDPPIPVIWVGGLADPWLRHQAIVHGAEFLLPGPAGEMGETARWFREEVSLLVGRLLERRQVGGAGEALAFRELFVALHAEASPADARASILRFASGFFARGFLLAVRESHFESIGAYGLATPPARLHRGDPVLEEVVCRRAVVRLAERAPGERKGLASSLGMPGGLADGEVFPLLSGGAVAAAFVGEGWRPEGGNTTHLAGLLSRCGGLLGL